MLGNMCLGTEEPETLRRDSQTCRGTKDTEERLRPAEEPETLRRDSQTCRGTRDTEERLSDLQRNQRH
ncbi:hypothetical protein F7725_021305 [Dissostichus mawsoni]|uniref:Uncharacterized protein n=1 Tax=Dissostichus mawsoni TaxID=36200 RepID=A0A7J5YIJ5_DISMA|nr:hypothetical protein F7725_021305 [Dissostichus mawsoni]